MGHKQESNDSGAVGSQVMGYGLEQCVMERPRRERQVGDEDGERVTRMRVDLIEVLARGLFRPLGLETHYGTEQKPHIMIRALWTGPESVAEGGRHNDYHAGAS